MGLANYVMQKMMKQEAVNLAKWATETYPVMKARHPKANDQEIHKLMWFAPEDISKVPDRVLRKVERFCISINGLCYSLSMNKGHLKEQLPMRCFQFARYMDHELLSRGFQPQSRETRCLVLKALGFLADEHGRPWPSEEPPVSDHHEISSAPLDGYVPEVQEFFKGSFKGHSKEWKLGVLKKIIEEEKTN